MDESTAVLLDLVRGGDRAALDRLFTRCLPPLRRFARGRLPQGARGMLDTQDLVQDTVLKALSRLDTFDSRGKGALHAYLRQAVLNRIRDEARRCRRQPGTAELPEDHADDAASPLERAIGRQNVERYEAALLRLRPQDREAIVGRIELQYSFAELAEELGLASADAARMSLRRALERLTAEMVRGA